MEGLVHPQAEEMVLPSGLQLWVLDESPHAGTAWCHSHWIPHAAAVRARVGMGKDAPGSCGDSGGHFVAVALSVSVSPTRECLAGGGTSANYSICPQIYCCSPQTFPSREAELVSSLSRPPL